MGEKMKGLMKRSGSKLSVSKGSVNHIGTTPYRFKIDLFISYVDNVKNGDTLCVCLERRGRSLSTAVIQAKDKKAVFKETISLESTLFRKGIPKKKANEPTPETNEELKFDEKKAKIILRKDSADGKNIGKLALNLADYVNGVQSTVLADMKLSNGSTIATKIEATMLHMGKKGLTSSSYVGSETCSERTDMNSLENDSIFGDDDNFDDLEYLDTTKPKSTETPKEKEHKPLVPAMTSPISSASGSSESTASRETKQESRKSSGRESTMSSKTRTSTELGRNSSTMSMPEGNKESSSDIKHSPSLRHKLKSKIKDRKSTKKEKTEDEKEHTKKIPRASSDKPPKDKQKLSDSTAEINELRLSVEALKRENMKLRESRQSTLDEMDTMRRELEVSQEEGRKSFKYDMITSKDVELHDILREKDQEIARLQNQNESLLEELEEKHEELTTSTYLERDADVEALNRKIHDLEVALRREPQYIAVVDELKVTKVTLALATMEKEQAIFALQTARQEYGISPKR